MISDDVLALVQLDPPGIELCRVSNMKTKAEGGGGDRDGGATSDRGSRSDEPRMDKLCTLLLPPLRQRRDGTGTRARLIWSFCAGEHPGHQLFSCGPWPEYRHAPLGRRQMFRQSTKDSILSIEMYILGCEEQSRHFEVVVRCATLLAFADGAHVVPTATATADVESSNGDRDAVLAQAVAGDADADNDNGGVTEDGSVPWDAWGPQATAVSDHPQVGWRNILGERGVRIEHQICIRDYNPYRIRQARASMVAKGLSGQDCHEEEGNVDTIHPKSTHRIIDSSTIRGGEWFEEDVTTALPHLEFKADMPGCRAIYMELDQVLLHVDNLDNVSGMCRCDRLLMRCVAFG
jgi:hypothetical protein